MAHLRTVTGLRLFARFVTSANVAPRNVDILQHPTKVWMTSRFMCKGVCFAHHLPVCTATVPQTNLLCLRYSTEPTKQTTQPGGPERENDPSANNPETGDEKDEKQLSIYGRFKMAYKEHGKVLLTVHIATSVVWFGSFYMACHLGLDVIAFLEQIGLSDRVIKPFRSSSLGDVALAYLLYKLITPVRYTVTIGGTNVAIKYLRKVGKMEPQQEKIRDLMKESRVEFKQEINDRTAALKDKQSEILTKVKNRQSNKKEQKQSTESDVKDSNQSSGH